MTTIPIPTNNTYYVTYLCQCGENNEAQLTLQQALSDENKDKPYFIAEAHCFNCHVAVNFKFNIVPFTFSRYSGGKDPYQSAIEQHESFFQFNLKDATHNYRMQISNTLKRLIKDLESYWGEDYKNHLGEE